MVPRRWRRLHRKLCVIDGSVGFCGGINIIDDQDDVALGRLTAPRLDYSLRVAGPLVADMVSLAEKTGRLEEALTRASDILDKEVPDTIKKLVALIEPLTMAALGGLVLLLLLSVFLPIYKVVGQLKVK